jgi:hypothetical protein
LTNEQIEILIEIIFNAVRGNPKLKFSLQELNILKRELPLLTKLAFIRDAKKAKRVFKRLTNEALHSLINPCLDLL